MTKPSHEPQQLHDESEINFAAMDGNGMMSEPNRYPSYASCVARALSGSRHPLNVDELVSEVASSRPVGKAARNAVYRALDSLFQAVPVGSGRYGWLSNLLEGTSYCHPLTDEEIQHGYLLLDELEHSVFFPQFFQHYRPDDRVLTVSLFGGPTIRAEAAIERKTWSLRLGGEMSAWLDQMGAENRDDIIISVVDAFQGRYELKLRLRELRDDRSVEQRNIRLALLAEEIVSEDSRTRDVMPTWDLVARLIGRGFFKEMPPTDDLHYVLHEFSMLRFTDGLGYQLDSATSARPSGRKMAIPRQGQSLSDALSDWQYRELDFTYFDPARSASDASFLDQAGTTATQGDQVVSDDEICPAYQSYLDSHFEAQAQHPPLMHDEFHLLEAELDLLVQLESEFGQLLPEQTLRKESLAARLYIDPDTLVDLDWDSPDDPGMEDPPFWIN